MSKFPTMDELPPDMLDDQLEDIQVPEGGYKFYSDEEIANHPMFMGADVSADQLQGNDKMEALQSLLYYEDSPEVTAENFKENGNKALKIGRKQWDEALRWYSEAIKCKSPNNVNNSIYYSNRAHVHLLKKNFGHAVRDATKALEYNEKNVKAAYRAAKACAELSKWDLCQRFSTHGVELEADNQQLLELEKKAADEIVKGKQRERKRALEKAQQLRAKRDMDKAVAEYEVVVGQNMELGVEEVAGLGPTVEAGKLGWPLLIIYDETSQTDFIRSAPLEGELWDQIDEVLSSPAPWDSGRRYTPSSVAVFVDLNATKPVRNAELHKQRGGDKVGEGYRRVHRGETLKGIMQSPGVVTFANVFTVHVVVEDSDFCRRHMQ